MKDRFIDKTVLITGASGGIGSKTAELFYAEGAKLCLVGRNIHNLSAVKEKYGFEDSRCMLAAVDMVNEETVQELISNVIAWFGRLDVMFNNAGTVGETAKAWDYPTSLLQEIMNTNVMGTFFGMKYALQAMLPQKSGVVINTGSISSVKGMTETLGYVASKHAVLGMTRTAAVETASLGIRVCAVCPAPVDTPMIQAVEDGMVSMGIDSREEIQKKLTNTVPMARYATVDEVAKTVLFLASDDASFISGSAIMVDGGFSA